MSQWLTEQLEGFIMQLMYLGFQKRLLRITNRLKYDTILIIWSIFQIKSYIKLELITLITNGHEYHPTSSSVPSDT